MFDLSQGGSDKSLCTSGALRLVLLFPDMVGQGWVPAKVPEQSSPVEWVNQNKSTQHKYRLSPAELQHQAAQI